MRWRNMPCLLPLKSKQNGVNRILDNLLLTSYTVLRLPYPEYKMWTFQVAGSLENRECDAGTYVRRTKVNLVFHTPHLLMLSH